ncbi:PilN domain-containing protein [Denitratisoma oestradiolicum]|uniref:Fimbrial protein n=1 Tax=Denitratisoma oestradiolicum TaxID=311182 RepID=A0A6S6YB19_9PROT|nr:PilN domain-containing protein [Denitratisoma oestradiolicum]TWO80026.1 hypothetical protein CBW56_11970 [Denitratisoma oestradiolicum]CAB1369794.1 Fimbrial protein [Denitratisoma oestradiolicum]
MIRINLLPHREEKRKARREQFFALLGVVAIAVVLIWFLGFSAINGYIKSQNAKNKFLEKEIEVLKKEIAEISSLKEQTDALLKRKQVIESLQGNRSETASVFDELLKRVPDGVRLLNYAQNGANISLSGESVSEARVSALMRNLEESLLFQAVSPLEIRAVTAKDGRQVFGFQMKMVIERPATGKEELATVGGAKVKKSGGGK